MIEIGISIPAREARLAREVNAERARRLGLGVTVDVPGIGMIHVQDPSTLTDLGVAAQAMIANGDLTTRTRFRDADNAVHDMSPEQVVALWQGALAAVQAIYEASWVLKDAAAIPFDYNDDRFWP